MRAATLTRYRTGLRSSSEPGRNGPIWRWLDRPLSGIWCLFGWALSTGLFVGLTDLWGGPTRNDSSESVYSTWAIAHDQFGCAFPRDTLVREVKGFVPPPHIAPLWPLISGGLAAIFRIGHEVVFPARGAFDPTCSNAYSAIYRWANDAHAYKPTVELGYFSWFVLLAGFVALLRASGKGRRGWEAFGVVLLAAVPVVWEPLLDQYHPQDIVALGLTLGGMACIRKEQWIWAGVLLGAAVTSQQFALLALVPLFVIVPGRDRWRLALGSAGTWAVISLSMVVLTSGMAWDAVIFGSGDYQSEGGTWLWMLNIHHGPMLVFLSRILPIIVAGVIAWCSQARLGPRILEPGPLVGLITICLAMRLVFEQGIFDYKFLALTVMLLTLDVVCGYVRGEVLAWILLASVAYNPIPYGLAINTRGWAYPYALNAPYVVLGIFAAWICWGAIHKRIQWYLLGCVVVLALFVTTWAPFLYPPNWVWQLLLVVPGVALAAEPLIHSVRQARHDELVERELVQVSG